MARRMLRIYREQVVDHGVPASMSHNAALLQQVGYTQLRSGNQLIASLAQEMVDAGVHVRLYTFMALIVLQVRTSLQWLPLFSAATCGDVPAWFPQACCRPMPCSKTKPTT